MGQSLQQEMRSLPPELLHQWRYRKISAEKRVEDVKV
jgi:hypothetical protein